VIKDIALKDLEQEWMDELLSRDVLTTKAQSTMMIVKRFEQSV
jgi:hypothetical protein